MGSELRLIDETSSGVQVGGCTIPLRVAAEKMTVRELIARRVQTEVERFNSSSGDVFRGLVEPEEAERVLNGYRLRRWREINGQSQVAKAWDAFGRNGFLLFVGDAQVDDLDAEVVLTETTDVRFVKLVPLVGG